MRRVAVVRVDQVRSARLRGLDVGGPGPVIVDQEHPGRYGATGRVLDRGRQRLATEGVAEHVEEPGTAVRHRRQHQVVVRRRGGPPAGHRHRRLLSGQRPGEPGRGEDDAHTVMLAGPLRHVRTQMFVGSRRRGRQTRRTSEFGRVGACRSERAGAAQRPKDLPHLSLTLRLHSARWASCRGPRLRELQWRRALGRRDAP